MATNETERTAIEFSNDGKVETITVDPASMGCLLYTSPSPRD